MTDVSKICGVVIFRVNVSCTASVDCTKNSGYRPDWSIKSRCYRSSVGYAVMSLVRFDPSIVKVKQSFNVSQIVGCPVILS